MGSGQHRIGENETVGSDVVGLYACDAVPRLRTQRDRPVDHANHAQRRVTDEVDWHESNSANGASALPCSVQISAARLGLDGAVLAFFFNLFIAKKIILMPVSVAVFDTWPNTAVARPRQETFKARTKMHRHAALTEPLQPSTSTSLPSALFRFTLPIESHCSVTVTLEPWQGDQNKGGIPKLL